MRLIAVTGAKGFIGKYVVNELMNQDIEVFQIDRSIDPKLDVRSDHVRALISEVDGVIHLAGVLGTDELFDDAKEAVDVNINGTINVLQGCAARPGDVRFVGITMPQVWDNVYQATKLAAGKLAAAWHRHYGVPVSHVRAFNVFGVGQKVGKPQKIIPTFADALWKDLPVPVWGDGEQIVDLVFARDVARMLVEALRFGDNQVLDAGTATPYTVNEVAKMVFSIADKAPHIEHRPMRRGEHGPGVVATGEGWDLLSWRPQFRIEDLVQTVESYKER